jgi:hypothetical protein
MKTISCPVIKIYDTCFAIEGEESQLWEEAPDTLRRILQIVKDKLIYDPAKGDAYAHLSQQKLWENLLAKAGLIRNEYIGISLGAPCVGSALGVPIDYVWADRIREQRNQATSDLYDRIKSLVHPSASTAPSGEEIDELVTWGIRGPPSYDRRSSPRTLGYGSWDADVAGPPEDPVLDEGSAEEPFDVALLGAP